MKIKNISKYDIEIYIRKYKLIYISYFVALLIGIIMGIVISVSNDAYLKILNKDSKILYSIINGSVSGFSIFGNRMVSLMLPLILIFILGLNFYMSLFSYLIVAYQSSILTLTIFAIVTTYGISGILNSLFIILPINILYILVVIFFSSVCLKRSYYSLRAKNLSFGFKEREFIYGIFASILIIILILIFACIIIPTMLKSAIFIIF